MMRIIMATLARISIVGLIAAPNPQGEKPLITIFSTQSQNLQNSVGPDLHVAE
jgi:hypothetical protein